MSQQNQGTNSFSSADLPMKRKRGRPRKNEILVQGAKMPGSDSGNQHIEVDANDDFDDDMVGQVVSGVLEGSFDAGYFLTVKVGNTDTLLRGVVFVPGLFIPISVENDVAPHAKMYIRKEVPIPVLSTQTQVHGSIFQLEQNKKQPVQLEHQAPIVPELVLPSELQSGNPFSFANQSASVTVPLTDNNLPKNDTGPSLGGEVMPQQTLEFGLENQSASDMANLERNRIVKQDDAMQKFEASTLIKGQIDIEAAKDSELEPASEPYVDILQSNEAINLMPQVQHQVVGAGLKLNESVHEELKSPNLELHQSPVGAEPKSIEPISKPIELLVEQQASLKNDIPQDILSELAIKILRRGETSHLNGRPVSAANITEGDSQLASKTSQPGIILQEEAIIPSQPNLAPEGYVLPGMADQPQISSSSSTNDVNSSLKYAIPNTQSQIYPVVSNNTVASENCF